MFVSVTLILLLQLIAVVYIDMTRLIIPDLLNLAIATTGIAVKIAEERTVAVWVICEMAIVYAAFSALSHAYRIVRKRKGIGGGDIKLLAAATAWIGLEQLPWLILVASISGLLLALVASLLGKLQDLEQRLPFGPHLSLGLFSVWLMSNRI